MADLINRLGARLSRCQAGITRIHFVCPHCQFGQTCHCVGLGQGAAETEKVNHTHGIDCADIQFCIKRFDGIGQYRQRARVAADNLLMARLLPLCFGAQQFFIHHINGVVQHTCGQIVQIQYRPTLVVLRINCGCCLVRPDIRQ